MKHKVAIFITGLLIILTVIGCYQQYYFWLIIGGIVIAFFSITAFGSYYIQANYFVKSYNTGKPLGIALTFDDGPDELYTPKILKILEQYNCKATFFVIGEKAELHPSLILDIINGGHRLGNHSYSHSNFIALFTSKKLQADLEKCSAVIQNITGKKPVFFRPPFGVTTPRYNKVLTALKLQSIGWSIRSYDTMANDSERLLKGIVKQIKPGAILLLHDTQQITAETLPAILNYCDANSIKIVNLPQLIDKHPYENS